MTNSLMTHYLNPLSRSRAPQITVPKAVDHVIVHQSYRLHERVADGGADEAEAAALEVFAQGVRLGSAGGDVTERAPPIDPRRAVDELPGVAVEAAELALDVEERLRVRDRALDLAAVAHDAGVGEQTLHTLGGEARHAFGGELVEGAAIVLTLLEDRRPAQPRLRALERQELEQHPVVVCRHA